MRHETHLFLDQTIKGRGHSHEAAWFMALLGVLDSAIVHLSDYSA